MYLIFERLNTGGTQLSPMEIRKAVYHGRPYDFLANLNDDPDWRKILGQRGHDKRLKDVELVLRVLALSVGWRAYTKSMKGFLNRFMDVIQVMTDAQLEDLGDRFGAATATGR